MRHALAWLLTCHLAVGAPGGQAVLAEPAAALAQGGAVATSPTTRTSQEQALVDTLIRLAQEEGLGDTDLPRLLPTAMASGNPWVRANVFATAAIVVGALRAAPSPRGPSRLATFADLYWSMADTGLADGDVSVRRYALRAASTLALDPVRAAAWQQRLRRLFEDDPAGNVRAVAFDVLVSPNLMPELDMLLVERAIADPSPSVKYSGFNALWLRHAPGYQAVMLAKLHEERDANTRIAAAEALRNVVPEDRSVVDAVAARLAVERDPVVRQRMSAALAQMKDLAARTKKPGA